MEHLIPVEQPRGKFAAGLLAALRRGEREGDHTDMLHTSYDIFGCFHLQTSGVVFHYKKKKTNQRYKSDSPIFSKLPLSITLQSSPPRAARSRRPRPGLARTILLRLSLYVVSALRGSRCSRVVLSGGVRRGQGPRLAPSQEGGGKGGEEKKRKKYI
jgi:hypothetical protein